MMDLQFNREYIISDPTNRLQVGNRDPSIAAIYVCNSFYNKMLIAQTIG